MRGLPVIAKAAEVPNVVKSFGTTWQQSGHPQFRRLWLARFTRTYPTQVSLGRGVHSACSIQFRRFFQQIIILLLSVARESPGLDSTSQHYGTASGNCMVSLQLVTSYNGHRPGLCILNGMSASKRAKTGKAGSYRLVSEPAICAKTASCSGDCIIRSKWSS